MNVDLTRIENVTLYTGNNGAAECTCNCPCCSQRRREERYQGTLAQALKMFEKLPSLKQLYVFGNPDPTVDTELCHNIMLEAVKRNIHVCFSTSGVGGEKVLKKLLDGIPTNMVDYISFSFDGTTQEEMSFAKGIKYPMKASICGVQWAIKNGYIVKEQATLWAWNYQKVEKIISFFYEQGIRWFTFHIGSLESNVELETHQHLLPYQVKMVHSQIDKAVEKYKDIKVRCPIIYLELGNNDIEKWYCMYPERTRELLIIFSQNGIQATHAPIASGYRKDFTFMLDTDTTLLPDIPSIPQSSICPFSYELAKNNKTCCRYISRLWNY